MPGHRTIGIVSALATLLLTTSSAMAELTCETVFGDASHSRAQQTDVEPQVRLDRIGAAELLENRSRTGRRHSASQLIAQRFRVRRIVRRIPNLWRRRIPMSMSPAALRVEHRLVVAGMRTTSASQFNDLNKRLPVVVRRTAPVVLCKRGAHKIVQGGVIIEFAMAALPAAGQYQLQIETDVELP